MISKKTLELLAAANVDGRDHDEVAANLIKLTDPNNSDTTGADQPFKASPKTMIPDGDLWLNSPLRYTERMRKVIEQDKDLVRDLANMLNNAFHYGAAMQQVKCEQKLTQILSD